MKPNEITGIAYGFFQRISAKFPDVSPMDKCAFGLLKRALSKRKNIKIGNTEDEWQALSSKILRKVLLLWNI